MLMLLVLLVFSRRRGTPLGELMLVRRGHDAFTRESAKQPAGGGMGILGSRSTFCIS